MKGVLSTAMTGNRNLIGDRLRQARLAKKPPVTQAGLSKLVEKQGIQLTFSSIGKIEQGLSAVTDKQLVAFSKALEVSVTWLLGI